MNRKQRRAKTKAAPKSPSCAPVESASLQTFLNDAFQHHRVGRLAEAEAVYRRILVVDPSHPDALHLLGVIAHQITRNDVAVQLTGKAIFINGNAAGYHSNRGLALKALRRPYEALASYDAALCLKPDYVEALSNRGNMLRDLERPGEALASYDAALRLKPDFAAALSNRGSALQDLSRPGEALASYDAALRLKPDFAEALSNRASALKDLGRPREALASCDAALCLTPDYAKALSNRGNALQDLGRSGEALASFDAALRLQPDFAEALSNRGNALQDMGRPGKALAAYTAALCLKPNYLEALSNRGNALKDLGRPAEALISYDAALRFKPGYAEVLSNRLICLHYQERTATDAIFAAARLYGAHVDYNPSEPSFLNRPEPGRQLRIGYVSGDFGHHPVGYFLAAVLANHNRLGLEVFCYSAHTRNDDLTIKLRSYSDHWRSLVGLNDEAAAALVRADGIDILIDLSGHTAYSRLPMFSLRPAPLQVTWLGYFGTTGLVAMDYILADRFVVRNGEEGNYVERICRLPDSYLCFSPPDLDLAIVQTREPRPITFGSFNYHAKTSHGTIALWSRLLARLPESRLLLKTKALGDDDARRLLLTRFAEHEIGPERLMLEGASPRAELLAAYNRLDIALDPTPYGGGTTTAEALWMGVPVVTLRGGTWVGRVSESILATVGLSDLVASCEDEYLAIVLALAADPDRRASLRLSLRAMVERSPLCDGRLFTRHLEAAFREMWLSWCANGRR